LKARTKKNKPLLAETPFSLENVTTTLSKWHHILFLKKWHALSQTMRDLKFSQR
jgi:hypothetical protein